LLIRSLLVLMTYLFLGLVLVYAASDPAQSNCSGKKVGDKCSLDFRSDVPKGTVGICKVSNNCPQGDGDAGGSDEPCIACTKPKEPEGQTGAGCQTLSGKGYLTGLGFLLLLVLLHIEKLQGARSRP